MFVSHVKRWDGLLSYVMGCSFEDEQQKGGVYETGMGHTMIPKGGVRL